MVNMLWQIEFLKKDKLYYFCRAETIFPLFHLIYLTILIREILD